MLDTLLLALLQARADDDAEAVADLLELADDPDTVSAMVADDEGDEPDDDTQAE